MPTLLECAAQGCREPFIRSRNRRFCSTECRYADKNRRLAGTECVVSGCSLQRKNFASGLCQGHDKANRIHGHPEATTPCECECGEAVGKGSRFVHGHNGRWFSGERSASWKGGRTTNQGYIMVRAPGHPAANAHGYILEHRLVVEQELGRYLSPWETVHHKNGEKADNRPENLELWKGKHGAGVRQDDYHCSGCRCG